MIMLYRVCNLFNFKNKKVMDNNLIKSYNSIIPINNFINILSEEKKKDIMYIESDLFGIITKISKSITINLNYLESELIGQFIGIFMNDLMSFLHKQFFISNYNNSTSINKKILDLKISGIGNKRNVIIYDKFKNPHHVNISIINKPNNGFIIKVEYEKEINIKLNKSFYTYDQKIINNNFIKTENEVIIINIDFINSTELIKSKGILNMINITKSFYNDIINLIKNNYYPYIYIHEIVGDGFMLVSNIDWLFNFPEYSATIVLNFVQELYELTKEYIDIRIGISYGQLYYGYIDNNLRFFGDILSLSNRLENKCNQNEVLVQYKFYKKLLSEIYCNNINYDISFKREISDETNILIKQHRTISNITTHSSGELIKNNKIEIINLKGFGDTECIRIQLNKKIYDY